MPRGVRKAKPDLDIRDVFQPQDQPVPIGEIRANPEIEVVSDLRGFDKMSEDEAFMNEKVVICVANDPREGELQVITVSVNGVNQPIIRDVDQIVKRKYVEALAHSVTTTYSQRTPNPMEPDKIQMVPRTTHSYPISIRQDTEKGRAWFRELVQRQSQVAA